jgi:apolipoprotein N-acyltransferase
LLLPALWWLEQGGSFKHVLLQAWLLSVAFSLGAFSWFGTAIDHYAQWPAGGGLLALALLAPLFQPQFFAWALLRQWAQHWAPQSQRTLWQALGASAAWVAAEWLFPKWLGDSLGHGLYPAEDLRQFASVAGVAGLTLILLLLNETLFRLLTQAAQGWRSRKSGLAAPAPTRYIIVLACVALCLPAAPTLWAIWANPQDPGLTQPQSSSAARQTQAVSQDTLRVALVQANMSDYETRRQTQGSYAVVREVLDTHYAMSYDAVERQQADAVLWSETIYPTTFGQAKSEAGAELDREILSIIQAAGVPFVFGTYDRDAQGEYNAAALVMPQSGLLAMYRKSRLFPLTETVPAWLDGPLLQHLLPWAGRWQAGAGAQVFPLRLRDGREIPVQPLICREDSDPALAIEGARLGARALLTMSNDAWFSRAPLGAQLHHAVAAFRSIETGLPQFRVTTNGYSAIINPRGDVVAAGDFGQRTLVVGSLPVPEPRLTLQVRWGNWLPSVALTFLVSLGLIVALSGLRLREPQLEDLRWPARVALLSPLLRWVCAFLRGVSRASVLGLGVLWLVDEGFRNQLLWQLRLFAALVVAPEVAAWSLLASCRATVNLESAELHIARQGFVIAWPVSEVSAVRPWRLRWPGAGVSLTGPQGQELHLQMAQPLMFCLALAQRGAPLTPPGTGTPAHAYAWAQQVSVGSWLQHPAAKFLGLPLALALPAFALHQHIAYGGYLGELYTFGALAYLRALGIWWAAWAFGVAVTAAVARMGIEALAWLGALWRPHEAVLHRMLLERSGLALLYLGMPAWLMFRIWGA